MKAMNIESVLIAWLESHLNVPVFSDVPNPRPASFVTVERTGGSRDNHIIDRPTIALQCWANSRGQAAELACEIDSLVSDMTTIPGITKAARNSLYNFPDLSGAESRARYQIVLNLVTTR